MFTIKKLDDLKWAFLDGGTGHFTENRPWVTARQTILASNVNDERLPIFFSAAEHTGTLHFWAQLTAIEVNDNTTTYHFDELRQFQKKPKQTVLRVAKTGEQLSPNQIRPYVLCLTPKPGSSLYSQMFAAEWSRLGDSPAEFDLASLTDHRERVLQDVTLREEQSGFRNKLIVAYKGSCAVTGFDASESLEAAHIAPYCGKESNHVANGLLLRADIHKLFDLNLIGIDPETLRIVLVPRLCRTSYADLQGKKVAIPLNAAHQPNKDALRQRWQQFCAQQDRHG